ncbi:hypothetical protein [Vogesella indigofera]|uniref:Superfamily III holin-X n=1 Tax=Vogesella indigofera TaxID=45465 RepID=A0ABT5I759_VOGIN|nr:hypothetical protein [Vogesella indigofera]MDC7691720.1 hypothetical protein [Vogesella indigofera]
MSNELSRAANNEGGDPLVEILVASGTPQLGEDLSEDSIPASGNLRTITRSDDIQLEEWNHRKNMQISAFSNGFSFAALLYIVATAIGGSIAYGFVKGTPVNWHLTLLAAAFIIPPTVIVIVLIRSVYSDQTENSSDHLPALNLIKEIAVALKEVFSSGK